MKRHHQPPPRPRGMSRFAVFCLTAVITGETTALVFIVPQWQRYETMDAYVVNPAPAGKQVAQVDLHELDRDGFNAYLAGYQAAPRKVSVK